jgi:hypothetical protein
MAQALKEEHFTDAQIATMLGVHPVTVRKWRGKNKEAGCIKYGPPYEYWGSNVVYPAEKFREWCSRVVVIGGVPRMNLPVSSVVEGPQRETVKEVQNGW